MPSSAISNLHHTCSASARNLLTAVLVLGMALWETAQAQGGSYGGPTGFHNNAPPTSIREIRAHGYDDQYVMLRGRLTAYYGKDMYEFTDLNGDIIEVELDDDKNWSHIAKDQLIIIEGELDKDFFSVSIEVERAYPVQEPSTEPASP